LHEDGTAAEELVATAAVEGGRRRVATKAVVLRWVLGSRLMLMMKRTSEG